MNHGHLQNLIHHQNKDETRQPKPKNYVFVDCQDMVKFEWIRDKQLKYPPRVDRRADAASEVSEELVEPPEPPPGT